MCHYFHVPVLAVIVIEFEFAVPSPPSGDQMFPSTVIEEIEFFLPNERSPAFDHHQKRHYQKQMSL